jgi:starvation-inducible DNA-binding protein
MYRETSSPAESPAMSTKVNIGISAEHRTAVNKLLAKNLADLHVLYVKTRNVHWNIVGARFQPLHEFFEGQYTAIAEAVDEVAERIRMLGGVAPGSMKEFLAAARLEEREGAPIDGDAALVALDADHEAVIRQLRKDIDKCAEEYEDQGTADFLTGLLRDHEKTAWMLRSFLQKA